MRADIDGQRRLARLQAAARQGVVAGPLARADQRDHRAGRRRVLDDAAPRVGEPDQLAHPVDHDLFELGQRRARLPGEAERAEPRAEIVAEHGGQLAVGGEIAEEFWRLPVRKPGDDQLVEIAEDGVERFRLQRRLFRQRRPQRAGRVGRHDRPLGDGAAIIRDPVDQLMADATKFLRRQSALPLVAAPDRRRRRNLRREARGGKRRHCQLRCGTNWIILRCGQHQRNHRRNRRVSGNSKTRGRIRFRPYVEPWI